MIKWRRRPAASRTITMQAIAVPDVLIQAHSASMGTIIYDGDQFPSEYVGDAFAAQHGSCNCFAIFWRVARIA